MPSSKLATRFTRLREFDARLGQPTDAQVREELAEAYSRAQRMSAMDLASRSGARSS